MKLFHPSYRREEREVSVSYVGGYWWWAPFRPPHDSVTDQSAVVMPHHICEEFFNWSEAFRGWKGGDVEENLCFPCWVSSQLKVMGNLFSPGPCSDSVFGTVQQCPIIGTVSQEHYLGKSCIHHGRLSFPPDAQWHGNSLFHAVLLWLQTGDSSCLGHISLSSAKRTVLV